MLISFTRNWQNYLKSLATFHQWTKLCLRVNDVKMIAEKYQIQNVGSDILKNDGKPRAVIRNETMQRLPILTNHQVHRGYLLYMVAVKS